MAARGRMVRDIFEKTTLLGTDDPECDFLYSEYFYRSLKKRPKPSEWPILSRGNRAAPRYAQARLTCD